MYRINNSGNTFPSDIISVSVNHRGLTEFARGAKISAAKPRAVTRGAPAIIAGRTVADAYLFDRNHPCEFLALSDYFRSKIQGVDASV